MRERKEQKLERESPSAAHGLIPGKAYFSGPRKLEICRLHQIFRYKTSMACEVSRKKIKYFVANKQKVEVASVLGSKGARKFGIRSSEKNKIKR